MTLLQQIAEYLEDQGIGTVSTDIFYSVLPDPDEGESLTIAVLENSEGMPEQEIPTNRPEFQIFIRSNTYDAGKAKYDAIKAALHSGHYAALVSGGKYFYYIYLRSGGHLGVNPSNGKDEFSLNFYSYTR